MLYYRYCSRSLLGLQSCAIRSVRYLHIYPAHKKIPTSKKDVGIFGARSGTASSQASYRSFRRRRQKSLITLFVLFPSEYIPMGALLFKRLRTATSHIKKTNIPKDVGIFGARGGTASSQASYRSFRRKRQKSLITLFVLFPSEYIPMGALLFKRLRASTSHIKNTNIPKGCWYFWCARRDLNPHVRSGH